jgi:hypothetical protein
MEHLSSTNKHHHALFWSGVVSKLPVVGAGVFASEWSVRAIDMFPNQIPTFDDFQHVGESSDQTSNG